MAETHDVVIIGAGQAGLSLSHELTLARREHVLLERGKVGQSWRGRWDSFCLVLPNWTIQLSGQPYAGDEPDGFMRRDDFVRYLASYAESFQAPVREGVSVNSLQRSRDGGRFHLSTSAGEITAREVVVASGGYQKPHRPAGVEQLPKSMLILDVESYTNPTALPSGKVLVVGSGQSGCQVAEDLALAGRDVFLSCGRAPWIPRRIGDRDVIAWLARTSFFDATLAVLPSPMARLNANPQVSGRDGGHDLNYRTLQAMGVNLVGHFVRVEDGRARFAPDLAKSVAFGDALYEDICKIIRKSAEAQGIQAPIMPTPRQFSANPPESVKFDDFSAVIITSGFRPDYQSWIRFPDAFDQMGFPIQQDGSSTVVPGLHFMGVHFQRKRASATLLGVGEDAQVLANGMVSLLPGL
ncbi:MAG TPA: NAD(P)-binding domain-containing protein [Nitrososphaerales archaeon]|nr:NAD(P)-binding domain-containing protein [Nitrososphaerales archaeon]